MCFPVNDFLSANKQCKLFVEIVACNWRVEQFFTRWCCFRKIVAKF